MIAAAILLLVVLPSAARAQAGRIQVLAEVLERTPRTPTVNLPLPHSIARDSAGRIFRADANGVLDARGASGDLTISLDSPYFRIRADHDDETEITLTIPAARVASATKAVFGASHAPLAARMCRAHLDRARGAVLESMPEASGIPWFGSQVTCHYAWDEGCNAGWDGEALLFNRGNSRCEPAAHVADMIYHEYGHGVFQHVSRANGRDNIVTEGVADFFASTLTGDSRFAPDYWHGRGITWLRDLSDPKRFPEHARGVYTAALVYSSAWHALRSALAEVPSREIRGAFLRSLVDMRRGDGAWGSNLVSAARASIDELSRPAPAGSALARVPFLGCLAGRTFSGHGLVAAPSECARVEARLSPLASASPGTAALLLSVRNPGADPARGVRVAVGRQSVALGDLAPGASVERRLTISGACGRVSIVKAVARSSSDGWLASAQGPARFGWIGSARKIEVDLLAGQGPAAIPDAIPDPSAPSSALHAGDWLSFPFSARLSKGERVLRADLGFETDHPFADDLVLAVQSGSSAPREFYKGEEEIEVPRSFAMPGLAGAKGGVRGHVGIRDLAPSLDGSVLEAALALEVGGFRCP